MPSLHDIKSQIRSLNGLENFLGRREINELPNILWPHESIAGIIQGTYNNGSGILVATDKRLIFIDKGLLFGLKVEDFAYDKISSIKYQTGLIMGELTILASGNNAIIKNVYNGKLRYFAETVRMIMSGDYSVRPSGAQPPIKTPEPIDVDFEMEKIETHKELGIITEEEYYAAKEKLNNGSKTRSILSNSRPGASEGYTPAIVKWCFGIVFFFIGLSYANTEPFTGILYIGLGIFIIPPVSSQIAWTTRMKYMTAIGGFLFVLFVQQNSGSSSTYPASERGNDEFAESQVALSEKWIEEGNYDSARYYLLQAKNKFSYETNGATALEKQLTDFSSEDYFKATLVTLTDSEYSNLGTNTSKRFFVNEPLNSRFIDKLKVAKKQRLSLVKEKQRLEAATKKKTEKKPVVARKWYEGGTLHDASIDEWKKATNRDKLATCADYALLLHPEYDNVDELRPYALAISVCIDEGTVDDLEMFMDLKVHEAAAMCILLIKKDIAVGGIK